MIIFFSILFGLLVGSFLNVCIHRMPQNQSIIFPRSYCPHCKHTIPWHDNIPVLSYIMLGGKCRFCKSMISPRYMAVEVLTGSVFALLIGTLGFSIITVIYIILACGMIVSTFIDLKYQIIPDEITYGGMVLGLVLSFAFPQLHGTGSHFKGLLFSVIGLLAGGAMIYAIGVIGKMIFKKDAMGGGDVKFLAMAGAFLGWEKAVLIFFLAPFFGSVLGLYVKFRYKEEVIPYGPFLSLAALMVMVWGDAILMRLFSYY